MTTLTDGRPESLTTFAAPTPGESRDADRGIAAHGVARRLLERFALIAFGLYHIPLFLNNYPSLGGGGFNDDGLAPRWGHVFTPPGVWVARHVFHLTGAMPTAYQGDNGDVGEEFGRLLLAVLIGVVGAVVWTVADRRRPRSAWVDGTLRVLLRYSIALGLAGYAFAKLLPVQFPPLTAVALEDRLGDLSPMALLWRFMEYSRPYNFFGGVMEIVVVALLCFRRTALLGALVCLAVMTNVAALNYAYGVQVKLYSTMIVASAAVLVLCDAPRLLAMFVRNAPVDAATLSSPLQDRLPDWLRWTTKVVLVGSVVASSLAVMLGTSGTMNLPPSDVDGGWIVTSFTRDGQALDSTANPARWRRVTVDGFGVAIRLEADSLLRCRRTNPTQASTISFACSRNRKGELRWTRAGDALQLEGTFDNAAVTVAGRYLNPSDSPLMRSRFRWIYDR